MKSSPALVAGFPQPATSFPPETAPLTAARGRDGRLVHPGDQVGYEVREGFWAPGSVLNLEQSVEGRAVAWILSPTPELAPMDGVAVADCIRLLRPDR